MTVRVAPWKQDQDGPKRWRIDIRFRKTDGAKVRDRVVHEAPTVTMAKKWGLARETQLRDGSLVVTKDNAPTWDEFFIRFEGHAVGDGIKPSTLTTRRWAHRVWLSPAFGKLRLDMISDERISKLKSEMAKSPGRSPGTTLSPKTVSNILGVLGAGLNLAKRWHVIRELPCTLDLGAVHFAKPEFYDFEPYNHLCEGAAKVGTLHHALVRLGGDAGLRRGEMMSLRWSDVDFRRSQIRVERAAWARSEKTAKASGLPVWWVGTTKGGKGRVVPLTKSLAEALQAHRHLRGELVLCMPDGSMIPGHTFRDLLMQAQRRSGMVATGGLHKLRHTFCSHLAMRGAPVRAIQELAGHASLTTTLRYMHLSPSTLDAAIALLDMPAPASQAAHG